MKGVKDKLGKFKKNIPVSKECLSCSQSFPPRHDAQKFCKMDCFRKTITKDHVRKCAICSNEFSAKSMKTRFCSQKCYTESGLRTKSGSESHLWKGGITPINMMVRSSGKYKEWVKVILSRDSYTCVECGVVGASLHVDHIIPFAAIMEKIKFEFGLDNVIEEAMRSELLWDLNNGRTLCVPCHKETDSYLNRNANKYGV